jgi:hypothetical protein
MHDGELGGRAGEIERFTREHHVAPAACTTIGTTERVKLLYRYGECFAVDRLKQGA